MECFRADWRDAKQYPAPDCMDGRRLAWEFLRRNASYAQHVAQMRLLLPGEFKDGLKRRSTTSLDGLECWPKSDPSETASAYFARVTDRVKGKKGRIDKPRNTFLNRWALEEPVDPALEYDADLVKFVSHHVRSKRPSELQTQSFNLFLYPNEVAVRFRLDIRLKQQIELAKKQLDEAAGKFEKALLELHDSDQAKRRRFVSVRETRERTVHKDAHYWLRSYDAFSLDRVLVDDEELRTAHESGEAAIRKVFASEEGQKNLAKKRNFARGLIVSWRESADSYINGMKFQTLLHGGDEATSSIQASAPNELTNAMRSLVRQGGTENT